MHSSSAPAAADSLLVDDFFRLSQQTRVERESTLVFVADDDAVFRAALDFDFAWHHLQIELYRVDNGTQWSPNVDRSASAPWRENRIALGSSLVNFVNCCCILS